MSYIISKLTKDGLIGVNPADPNDTIKFATGDYFTPTDGIDILSTVNYFKRSSGSNKYLKGHSQPSYVPPPVFPIGTPLGINKSQTYWGKLISSDILDYVKSNENFSSTGIIFADLVKEEDALLPFNERLLSTEDPDVSGKVLNNYKHPCMSIWNVFNGTADIPLTFDFSNNYPVINSQIFNKHSSVLCMALVSRGGTGASYFYPSRDWEGDPIYTNGHGGAGGNTLFFSLDLKYFYSKYSANTSSILITPNITIYPQAPSEYYYNYIASLITIICNNETKYEIMVPQGANAHTYRNSSNEIKRQAGANRCGYKIALEDAEDYGMYLGDIICTKYNKSGSSWAQEWSYHYGVSDTSHQYGGTGTEYYGGLYDLNLRLQSQDLGIGVLDYVLGSSGKESGTHISFAPPSYEAAGAVTDIVDWGFPGIYHGNSYQFWDTNINYCKYLSFNSDHTNCEKKYCGTGGYRNITYPYGNPIILKHGGAPGGSAFSFRTTDTLEPAAVAGRNSNTFSGYGAGGAGAPMLEYDGVEQAGTELFPTQGALIVFNLFSEADKPKYS